MPRLNQKPSAQAEKLKQASPYDDSDKKFEAPKKVKLVKKELQEGTFQISMMSQSHTKMTREKMLTESDSSKMLKPNVLKITGGPIKIKMPNNLKYSQIQFSPGKKNRDLEKQ